MKNYLSKISAQLENPLTAMVAISIGFVLLGLLLLSSNTCAITDYIDYSRNAKPRNSIICKIL